MSLGDKAVYPDEYELGMTLREHYAGKNMAQVLGALFSSENFNEFSYKERLSVIRNAAPITLFAADVLLAELAKEAPDAE